MKNKTILLLKNIFKKILTNWTILVFLAIVIYIGLGFYNSVYKPIYRPTEMPPQKLKIQSKVYEKIMDIFSQREKNINEILNKNYPDPFK